MNLSDFRLSQLRAASKRAQDGSVVLTATQRRNLTRRMERLEQERARLKGLLREELVLWRAGHSVVAGVDEVGVGPLAGPVIAAAVVLPAHPTHFGLELWPGLNDSKKLTAKRRAELVVQIKAHAQAFAIGIVDHHEIDTIGIGPASRLAMCRAVLNLPIAPDFLLVDARTLPLNVAQKALIGGDGRSQSIAAASIVAKQTRDALMCRLDETYPGYGLAQHAGYGTAQHMAALRRLGPAAVHRRSFAPVRQAQQAFGAPQVGEHPSRII